MSQCSPSPRATFRPRGTVAALVTAPGAGRAMPAEPVGPPVAGLTATEVDGCFHIFNPATQRAVALNATASDIWRLSTGEHDVAEIVAILARFYQVDGDTIEGEVRQVIDELAGQGLFDVAAAN